MERLTIDEAIKHAREVAETNRYKAKTYDDDFLKRFHTNTDKCKQCAEEHEKLAKWLEKLKAYEQAEEDGLLIRLPYNIATCGVIYFVDEKDGEIYRLQADKIEIYKMMISNKFVYTIDSFDFFYEDFGKIVFTTEAEAQQALAKINTTETIGYADNGGLMSAT